MSKKISKILADLNKYLDTDYQNLYDKMHNFELSHNRKVKLLKDIKMSINSNSEQIKPDYAYFLINLISRELNAPLKVQWRNKNG